MAYLTIPSATTSKIIMFSAYDSSSTTGAKLAGLVYNSAGLSAYYSREGVTGAAVAITLVTATKGTFTSSGFIAVDGTNMPGDYELHIPDAALATGARSVMIQIKGAANLVPVNILIELTATSNQDAVRGGMTALPNANAEAAGGLFTRGTGAGQIAQDANGNVRVNLDTIKTQTVTAAAGVTFPTSVASPTNITAATGIVLSGVTHTGAVIPTVTTTTTATNLTTNNDKTGYGLSSAAVQAIWDALTSALTTAGSIGKLVVDNLNAAITSRMATYTQPTGFLAATFPGGTVANTTNITAGTITTATNLTTNNDKTGYSLTATTGLGNQTANITGNLSGSVGSVTGAVGSVTGAVGSVASGVTVTTNNDKTGYTLTVTPPTSAENATAVLLTQTTESYRADGAAPTLAQALCEILAHLGEASIAGTTLSLKKFDGTTTAMTFTLDSATTPTSVTRAT